MYLRTSEPKRKKDLSCPPYPDFSDIPLESKSIKVEDKPKIFSSLSGPSLIKYSTENKEAVKGNEKGRRVRRLICITDMIPNRHTLDQTTGTEEKMNVSAAQCFKGENVIPTQQSSIACNLHYNKDAFSEKLGLRHEDNMIVNYKDAIAKLRGHMAWKSCSNPSENPVKSSFHNHIQTCILQLSNISSMKPITLTKCSNYSSILKGSSGNVAVSEGQTPRIKTGHHQGSFPATPPILVTKNYKLDGEKFVWRPNTQEISKLGTCDEKTGLVTISPLSSGKENAIHTQVSHKTIAFRACSQQERFCAVYQ